MTAPASAYRSFGEQSLHYFVREHVGMPSSPIQSPTTKRTQRRRDSYSSRSQSTDEMSNRPINSPSPK